MKIEYELLITDIPRECVEECAAGGRDASPYVEAWIDRLAFSVNRNRAICCLHGYGAWKPAELEEATDRDLATKILWLACGNFSEWYTEADAAGVTPDNIPDDFHPNCGSDVFCLE